MDLRDHGVVARTELEVLDLTRRQARLDLDGAPAYLVAGRDEADALVDRAGHPARGSRWPPSTSE